MFFPTIRPCCSFHRGLRLHPSHCLSPHRLPPSLSGRIARATSVAVRDLHHDDLSIAPSASSSTSWRHRKPFARSKSVSSRGFPRPGPVPAMHSSFHLDDNHEGRNTPSHFVIPHFTREEAEAQDPSAAGAGVRRASTPAARDAAVTKQNSVQRRQ